MLRDTLGERSEHTGHPLAATQDEGQALADAEFDRRARRFVVLEGTAEGNPAMRVGSQCPVSGMGSRVRQHLLRYRGVPPLRPGSRIPDRLRGRVRLLGRLMMPDTGLERIRTSAYLATYLAEVVAVDDPESLSRVEVRLLNFDGVTGQDARIWARVAAPFAGDGYGAFMIPDVGDEVLVSLRQRRLPLPGGRRLRCGTATQPPPETLGGSGRPGGSMDDGGQGGHADRHRRGEPGQPTIEMTTPGGVSCTMTDRGGGKTEVVAGGATVTIDPAGVKIVTPAKVEIEASQVKVTAASVTVDAAMLEVLRRRSVRHAHRHHGGRHQLHAGGGQRMVSAPGIYLTGLLGSSRPDRARASSSGPTRSSSRPSSTSSRRRTSWRPGKKPRPGQGLQQRAEALPAGAADLQRGGSGEFLQHSHANDASTRIASTAWVW